VRAAVGIWRWRRNPLRRATDLHEAWLALAAALLIVLTAPVAGWVAGALAEESLRQAIRVQRMQRHVTTATVLGPVTRPRPAAFDPETVAADERRTVVRAKWTAPDGSRHTGNLPAPLPAPRPGDTFRVWTDSSGRSVPRPMDPATAQVHAALAGVGAAVVWGLLLECARRLALWRLVRRRHADLDRAWAAVGPDWGRAGAGS
jgi:F0F1-type ATP synthase membrane subunit c/vacuolar-type H+-ATPase subunit K